MTKKSIISILALAFAVLPCSAIEPEGEGWTKTGIDKGIVYYSFNGFDYLSGAQQIVNVVDIDLNCRKYKVEFCYQRPDEITSKVMKEKNAVAMINAGYEPQSIVIEIDGQMISNMPNDFIFDSNVPNWKSEGAVYTDGKRKVDVEFSCRGMKDLDEIRAFYAADKRRYTISSAPVLIDNYELVGTTFADTDVEITKLAYEDPKRHQGVRHPRTAVAMTADNHFLMIVVDGRRKGISEGMSAKELTLFLARNFAPQYALNLDGGGSTTMCVEGQGDPETHVVNYPTDNGKFSHDGERHITTHIYVKRK